MLYLFHHSTNIHLNTFTVIASCCDQVRVKIHEIAALFKENENIIIPMTVNLLYFPWISVQSEIFGTSLAASFHTIIPWLTLQFCSFAHAFKTQINYNYYFHCFYFHSCYWALPKASLPSSRIWINWWRRSFWIRKNCSTVTDVVFIL